MTFSFVWAPIVVDAVLVALVISDFASIVPVTSTLCPTWFLRSLSCPLSMYDMPAADGDVEVDDVAGAVPVVPVGVPAVVPAGGEGRVGSVEPGTDDAVVDVDELLVIAFASM